MSGFYITSKGKKVILEPKEIIRLSNMDLVELVIPYGAKEIYCRNNKLTELDLPDSAEYVYCDNNRLTELIEPDDCVIIHDESCKVITRTMYNRSKRLKNILK